MTALSRTLSCGALHITCASWTFASQQANFKLSSIFFPKRLISREVFFEIGITISFHCSELSVNQISWGQFPDNLTFIWWRHIVRFCLIFKVYGLLGTKICMIAHSVADTVYEKKIRSYKTVKFEQKLPTGKSSLDANSAKLQVYGDFRRSLCSESCFSLNFDILSTS